MFMPVPDWPVPDWLCAGMRLKYGIWRCDPYSLTPIPCDRRVIVHRELLKGWRMCDPHIDEILDDLKKRFRELLGVTKPDALISR